VENVGADPARRATRRRRGVVAAPVGPSRLPRFAIAVFDDGRLADGKGRVVDFTNTIIIATSNVGSDLIQRNLEADERDRKSYQQLKKELMDLLRQHLRPELLNRIDEIIVFHALDREQIRQIVGLQLERVKRMAQAQGLTLEFDDSLTDHLAEVGYQPEFGARELRRQVRSLVEIELAGAMLRGDIAKGDTVRFSYDRQADKVRWEKRPAAAPEAAPVGAGPAAGQAEPGREGREREAEPGKPAGPGKRRRTG
jgi:ATP-dependent Clp protease ATP-binding subunit ClpC